MVAPQRRGFAMIDQGVHLQSLPRICSHTSGRDGLKIIPPLGNGKNTFVVVERGDTCEEPVAEYISVIGAKLIAHQGFSLMPLHSQCQLSHRRLHINVLEAVPLHGHARHDDACATAAVHIPRQVEGAEDFWIDVLDQHGGEDAVILPLVSIGLPLHLEENLLLLRHYEELHHHGQHVEALGVAKEGVVCVSKNELSDRH
mmetsp:Transcript_120672/g.257751  ORF Transcript_120672/g.257751 Transcript_120672/m.257751 type:complete len:200 (+) Transcript_120672:333-932(+)